MQLIKIHIFMEDELSDRNKTINDIQAFEAHYITVKMISTMLNVIITNVINQQFYVKRKYYKCSNQQVVVI